MPNQKISEMTNLATPADEDLLAVVDVSESADADKNKRLTVANVSKKVRGEIVDSDIPSSIARDSELPTVPSDTQIGDKAFSNPPSDLTSTEQGAVRDAIGVEAQRSRQDVVDLLVGDAGGDIDFSRDGSGSASDLRGVIRSKVVKTGAIADDAITSAQIADDAVTFGKIADNAVHEAGIVDGAVVTNKINNKAVTEAKLARDVVTDLGRIPSASPGNNKVWKTDGSGNPGWRDDATGGGSGGGEDNVQSDWDVTDTTSDAFIKNKPTIPTVPARAGAFTAADESKLDGIEAGAQVNVGVEFTSADESKLDGIEAGAQVNVGVEYTQAEKTKLGGVEAGAEVNPTDSEIGDKAFTNPPGDLTADEQLEVRQAIGAGTGSGGGSGSSPTGYSASGAMSFTPVTSDVTVANNGAWEVQLLADTFPAGIEAGTDFWSVYNGYVYLDVDTSTNYSISLEVSHSFTVDSTTTTFVSRRSIVERIGAGNVFTLPLNVFNSVSVVRLGEFTDSDGNTITITQDMLDVPTTLMIKLRVERANQQGFALEAASIERGTANFFQFAEPGVARSRQDTIDLMTGGSSGDIEFKRDGGGTSSLLEGDIKSGVITNSMIKDDEIRSAKFGTAEQAAYRRIPNTSSSTDEVWKATNTSGGGVWGAVAFDELGGMLSNSQVSNKSISGSKLQDGSVHSQQLGGGAVGNSELANAAVNTAKIADKAVTAAKIADGVIKAAAPAGLIITASETTRLALAPDGDTSGDSPLEDQLVYQESDETLWQMTGRDGANSAIWKEVRVIPAGGGGSSGPIADGSVTTAKLADEAVTRVKIAESAVTTTRLDDGAVTRAKLSTNAVDTNQLENDAVTRAKIGNSAVGKDELGASAVQTVNIANKAVTGAKVADKTITAANIADGVIPDSDEVYGSNTIRKDDTGVLKLRAPDLNSGFWGRSADDSIVPLGSDDPANAVPARLTEVRSNDIRIGAKLSDVVYEASGPQGSPEVEGTIKVLHSTGTFIHGFGSGDGYDATKPGFVWDATNNRFQHNGVAPTTANSGSTTNKFRIRVEVDYKHHVTVGTSEFSMQLDIDVPQRYGVDRQHQWHNVSTDLGDDEFRTLSYQVDIQANNNSLTSDYLTVKLTSLQLGSQVEFVEAVRIHFILPDSVNITYLQEYDLNNAVSWVGRNVLGPALGSHTNNQTNAGVKITGGRMVATEDLAVLQLISNARTAVAANGHNIRMMTRIPGLQVPIVLHEWDDSTNVWRVVETIKGVVEGQEVWVEADSGATYSSVGSPNFVWDSTKHDSDVDDNLLYPGLITVLTQAKYDDLSFVNPYQLYFIEAV